MNKNLTGRSCDISVGVLTADMMHLEKELALIEEAGVRILHFDVMDGNFCPMMTFGPPFIKAVKTKMFKDVHLMITNPLQHIHDYVQAGADILTVHVESTIHVHRVLQELAGVKSLNHPDRTIMRGVALNPGTPIETILPLLKDVELISLLAVNPGWGGQKLDTGVFEKMQQLTTIIAEKGLDIVISLDGGVTKDNIRACADAGADLIVTGSAVFDKKDPRGNALAMLERIGAISR
jgi:ribulose-phosphate 3-epimerase